MSEPVGATTEVDETDAVSRPAVVRERANVAPGDRLRWSVSDDGSIQVSAVEMSTGVFDDFEPVSMGGDGATTHDLTGAER